MAHVFNACRKKFNGSPLQCRFKNKKIRCLKQILELRQPSNDAAGTRAPTTPSPRTLENLCVAGGLAIPHFHLTEPWARDYECVHGIVTDVLAETKTEFFECSAVTRDRVHGRVRYARHANELDAHKHWRVLDERDNRYVGQESRAYQLDA